MLDHEFEERMNQTIEQIATIIEDNDTDDIYDVEINNGLMTIECKFGMYIINRQSFLKELWLSSPISGPHHYVFRDNIWRTKNQEKFLELLSDELKIDFTSVQPE